MNSETQACNEIRKNKTAWIIFWVYSFLLIHSSLMPPDSIPSFVRQINDKVLHAAEYFFLFIISRNAFRRSRKEMIRTAHCRFALFWGILVGIATETGQFFVPGRYTDFLDFAANVAGLTAGLGLVYLLNYSWKIKKV